MQSNLRLSLEYIEGNLAAWQDDPLPKHMKAAIGESLKEIRFVMGVADDLLAALQYVVEWDLDTWSPSEAKDRARAAITKALGKPVEGGRHE